MKNKFSLVVVFFIVGIMVAAAISTSAFKEAYRNRKIQREVEELKSQAQKIQTENDALRQKIAYLQTQEFQEKIAKEKLNMQKPEENVVVVKPAVQVQEESIDKIVEQKEIVVEKPNYQKWWNYFFKYE